MVMDHELLFSHLFLQYWLDLQYLEF